MAFNQNLNNDQDTPDPINQNNSNMHTFVHSNDGHGSADSDRSPSTTSTKTSRYNAGNRWDEYRDVITALYRDQNLHLSELMKIMAVEYDFTASDRMYKTRIKNWNIDKNLKNTDVIYMYRMSRARALLGKKTQFTVRGRHMDYKRLVQYMRRDPNLQKKIADEAAMAEMPTTDHALAGHITCSTPPPSPPSSSLKLHLHLHQHQHQHQHRRSLPTPWTDPFNQINNASPTKPPILNSQASLPMVTSAMGGYQAGPDASTPGSDSNYYLGTQKYILSDFRADRSQPSSLSTDALTPRTVLSTSSDSSHQMYGTMANYPTHQLPPHLQELKQCQQHYQQIEQYSLPRPAQQQQQYILPQPAQQQQQYILPQPAQPQQQYQKHYDQQYQQQYQQHFGQQQQQQYSLSQQAQNYRINNHGLYSETEQQPTTLTLRSPFAASATTADQDSDADADADADAAMAPTNMPDNYNWPMYNNSHSGAPF